MAWRVRSWEVALVALLLVTSGCLGQMTSPTSDAEDVAATTTPTSQDLEQSYQNDEDGAERQSPAKVSFELELTPKSRRTLRILSVGLDVPGDVPGTTKTMTGRLTPGGEAPIAYVRAEPGTQIPASRLNVAFSDGLGQVNLSLEVDSFHVLRNTTQTVELRSGGPGEIGFVSARGPLQVSATTGHAIPLYGYLQWPDGDRRVLPAFGHVIQVPDGFPEVPAGETAEFFLEVPAETPVVWRVDGDEPVEGRSMSFTPDPGLHHIRVSVGPGSASTQLLVRTDMEDTVNGTVAAATPDAVDPIAPVNINQHALTIGPDAVWVQLRLRSIDSDVLARDLDLRLLEPDGDTAGVSQTSGSTHEVLTVLHPRPAGEYTVQVEATSGAVYNYTLAMHVNY